MYFSFWLGMEIAQEFSVNQNLPSLEKNRNTVKRLLQVTWSEGVPAIRLLPKALTKTAYELIIITIPFFTLNSIHSTKAIRAEQICDWNSNAVALLATEHVTL